jgi:membrane protease YdiL (CAAX protease family)
MDIGGYHPHVSSLLRPAIKRQRQTERYGDLSRQPLYILVFLLPLLLFYELALLRMRGSSGGVTIKAHAALVRFLEIADMPLTGGLWLGGIAVATILLLWHVFAGFPWRIRPRVPAIMAAESITFALPLLAIGSLLMGAIQPAASGSSVAELGMVNRIAISIGAGIYEELLFRMMIIGGVHSVLCSLLRQSERWGIGIAVGVSAVAFAWYHDLPSPGTMPALRLVFYGTAGLYLALIYVTRGFGIAAGAHAAYDIVATAMVPLPE